MGNAAMDWARQEARRMGNPDSWLNTPQGGNYLGALARNYKAPTAPDPYANFQNKDPLTSAGGANDYWGGADKTPWAPGGSASLTPAPQANPGTMQAANFGTYMSGDRGALEALGMFGTPTRQDSSDKRDYSAVNNMLMNSALEKFNEAAKNPYGMDNSGYLASRAQIVGTGGQRLLNALKSHRAALGQMGLSQASGQSQAQDGALRRQVALGETSALNDLEAQRYDKAAAWDERDRAFRSQLAQARDSGNLARFSALMNQANTQYEQDRQRPFDALRAQGMQQDLAFNAQANPMRLSGMQTDLSRAQQMLPLDVAYASGRNTAQGLQNAYTSAVQPGMVDLANAQNRLGALGANQQYGILSTLGQDQNFQNNLLDTMRTQAMRGKVQQQYGAMQDFTQPARDFENQFWDRTDKQFGLLGNVLKFAGGGG